MLKIQASTIHRSRRKLFFSGLCLRADLDPNYAVYAKISVPLFEWGKRRNEKRASNQKIGMAKDNLNQIQDKVNLEIQTARLSLSQALDRYN